MSDDPRKVQHLYKNDGTPSGVFVTQSTESPTEQVPGSASAGGAPPSATAAGPTNAVLEGLKRKFKLGSISLDHTPLQVFVEVITPFVSEFDRLRAECERLKDDIRQMVEKAADKSLAGYRELGERAATAELRAERAEADNAALRADIERHVAQASALADEVAGLEAKLRTAFADGCRAQRDMEPTEAMVEAHCTVYARGNKWPDDYDSLAQSLRRDSARNAFRAMQRVAPLASEVK